MRILRMAQDETYSNEVDVSLYGLDEARSGMLTDEASWKVNVQFRIRMAHTSWGISDVVVSPFGVIDLPISMSAEADETKVENVTIRFDASQLKIDNEPSNGITVGEINLWVKPDMTPDYEASYITVHGLAGPGV